MDSVITHWLNALAGHSAGIDSAMRLVSSFGVPAMVLAVAAQWWLGSGRAHRRSVAVAAGLAFLGALAANQVVLWFVHRVRPYDVGVTQLLIAPSADPSFPSDHAAAAVAIAAAIAIGHGGRAAVPYWCAAVAIAVSRVYLGTHYVTDVAAGAVIGAAAAVVVSRCYREGTRLDRALTAIL